MKHTLFYILLFISNMVFSQKLVDWKDFFGMPFSNTYIYDNELNKFVGEWIYSNGNETLKMTFKKVKLNMSNEDEDIQNSFMDHIVCYFEYKRNNVIILSNYDSLKNPVPTYDDITNINIFYCFTQRKGLNDSKRNVLECFLKDPLKKHSNRLFLTINKDLNTLSSKNTYGPGGITIRPESDKPLDGFTFPDNMTLKKVK